MEETKEEVKEKQDFHEKVIKSTEEAIESLVEDGIQPSDVEMLDKLVDIHKDICEEKYWKRKENMYMNYGNYGNYSGNYNGNYGNYNGRNAGYDAYGRGNYGEYGNYSGNYGRRGRDARYRGDDEIDRMAGEYGRYQESRNRYGAGEETDKSFHYMVKSLEDFIKVLHEEANSQQQKQMLNEALQKSMM